MSTTVTITLNDYQVELFRRGDRAMCAIKMMDLITDALLPGLIQAGDTVRRNPHQKSRIEDAEYGEVLMVHADYAWVRWFSQPRPLTHPLTSLKRKRT